jgi:hypothetical protein
MIISSQFMQSHPFEEDEREGAQSHTTIMHDFRTVQTTTIVGGGKQFANSKSHIREEIDEDKLHTTHRRSVASLSDGKEILPITMYNRLQFVHTNCS